MPSSFLDEIDSITKDELVKKMTECEQTKGQNVLEHGISVKNYLFDLLNHIRTGKELKYSWMLPKWLKSEETKDMILKNLPSDETLDLYTTFHDCGKPFCVTVDEEGKRHFPDHARYSYETFNKFFDNEIASELILHDMDIHLLKSDGEQDFSNNPNATTLLISGLSEIHSNANMFGGIDSVSFKIKYKNIEKRGNHIIHLIKTKK